MTARRRILLAAGGVAVLVALAWLVATLISVSTWQEQALLGDGSVITIDRRVKYEVGGEIGHAVAWQPVEEELRFRDPKTGEHVRWKERDQIAMLLDRVDGNWWLVARRTKCHLVDQGQPAWQVWQAFRLDESGWTPIVNGPWPMFYTPNLLLDASVRRVTQRLSEVTPELKRHLNSLSKIAPVLRSIDLRMARPC